ncbi:choice-of-anchor Q domain-containing protein [Roseibacillus persicicus]|uniref:choice-of-anchor Q domain-containing protein n=1 Tax=Roseibacillus persicicus TaxID=454148 RepID=UPI00398B7C0C
MKTLFLALACCPPFLFAAEVTNSNDSGPGSLRATIASAADGETITFASGLANGTITLTSGEIAISDKSLIIDASPSGGRVTISADGNSRLFSLDDSDTEFRSLIFEKGSHAQKGGAIFIDGSAAEFVACQFEKCTAPRGGAVYSFYSSPDFSVCRFVENSATLAGGAHYSESSSPTFTRTDFDENTSATGGAAYHDDSFSVSYQSCEFAQNNATTAGGAIASDRSSVSYQECDFSINFAADGGSLYTNGTLSKVVQCSFRNGSANNKGGAIRVEVGTLSLTASSFQALTANDGGGAISLSSTGGTFQDCFFLSNQANDEGGALLLEESSPRIRNCTFQGNHSFKEGGAFYSNDSAPEFYNSIIWQNASERDPSSPESSWEKNGAATPAFYHCLVENWSASTLVGTGNLEGTSPANAPLFITPLNPQIAPWNVGGDLRLAGNSPLVDAGLDSEALNSGDFFGNPRIVGTVDLGAFEQQGPVYVNAAVGGGTSDGSSWANAYPKLQDALNQSAGGRRLHVAAGTYYPDESGATDSDSRSASFTPKRGHLILGGFPAQGAPPLSARDPQAHRTILSGDIDQNDQDGGDTSGNAYNVIAASQSSSFDHFDGVTIEAGRADGSTGVGRDGGGVYASSTTAQVSFTNCLFQKNHSATFGGAIAMNFASIYLQDCLFLENTASTGGAFFESNSASLVLNCLFQGNSAVTSAGALYSSRSTSRYYNCAFLANRGQFMGALGLATGYGEFTNCSFQGNFTESGSAIHRQSDITRFNNVLAWGNLRGDGPPSTGTLFSDLNSSNTGFSNCLIEYHDGSDLGNATNLDGTDPANDPLFLIPIDAASAPSVAFADLGLRENSPALDEGDGFYNPFETDILGNPRMVGPIDIGAYEGEITDLARLWFTDDDGDGSRYGAELALGTNPEVADPENPRNISIIERPNGNPEVSFGFNFDSPEGTSWRLYRSTSLDGDFTEIYRFNNPGQTSNVPLDVNIDSHFHLEDLAPPSPKAFYRFEAVYAPQQ